MAESLLDLAHYAIQLAEDRGAQGAWATAHRSRKVEFTGRDGLLEKVQENTSRSVGLQLYVDGRYSSHRTTSLRPERMEAFIAEAVELTRALAPDPHRQLPDPALFEGRSSDDLELLDGSVDAISREQRQAWLDELDAGARADEAVISATAYVSDTHSEKASASSNGFEGSFASTSVWAGAEVTVRDEGERRPEGGYWLGARQVKGIPGLRDLGAEALRRARLRLGSTQGPTGRNTMIVDPQAGGRLIRALLGSANARSIQQGRSFWTGKEGEQLFSPTLSIVDDPLIPRGLGSRPFDSEGIAAQRLPLVEDGTVRNVYVDTYYGRKAGLQPTTGGSSNVVVRPGSDKGLAELLAEAGTGIYVTSWLGGNSDGTTGDFSFGLRGHLVEGGVIGAPVGEMNVSGNLMSLFSSLAVVGNDPWPFRRSRVPTLVFEDVQFSGA